MSEFPHTENEDGSACPSDVARNGDETTDTGTKTDAETSVQELRQIMADFVQERSWHAYHHPKNLALALVVETGELLEHFQWLSDEQSRQLHHDPKAMADIREEFADCLSYLLSLANCLEIDVSKAFRDKMVKNRTKYPIGHSGLRRRD
ncbi:MAG: nucleotide pyrophosphohydrolase [Planctomycetota bacterium]